jgi:hypothetical protein
MRTVMHNHSDNSSVDPHSLAEGFEQGEMHTSLIWASITGILILMVGAGFTILLIMRGFEESRVVEVEQSPVAGQSTVLMGTQAMVPGYNGPLLQQDPVAERKVSMAAGVAKLESFGVHTAMGADGITPTESTVGHIPIEIAMKHLAEGKAKYKQEPVTALIAQ